MQVSLEQCKQRTIGKRGLSYEWFAKEPAWCPLTHVSELGERRKNPESDEEFFENTETLARVRGKIDSIKGPQAGLVRLGPKTTAFFLPGKKFSESRHLNSIVEFYVGFSYEGLRAWVADFVAEAVTTETRKKANDRARATPITVVSSEQVSIQKAEVDEKPLRARVHSFIRDQLVNAENRGKIMFVSSLGVLLQSHFGIPPIHGRLGAGDLEDLLASLPFVRLTRNGILSTVALAPEGSPGGRAPKKVPAVGRGGGRQGAREEMRAAEEIVLRALSESEQRRSTFLLSVAGASLLDYFKVPGFYRRFGFAKLRDFINAMDAVGVDSTGLLVVRRTSSTGRPS